MPSSSSSIPMHTTPMSNTSDSPTSATTSSLYWRDVTITVPSKEKPRRQGGGEAADGKNRTILHSNSGYVRPGELLFIMGPSGSGKSTLLDSLSARRPQGTSSTSGIQFINQSMKSTKDVRRRAKYVQQHDELNGVLTVSETLQINADLYLSLPAVERAQRVDETLAALGLGAHAHTKVGNAFFRGLSGGQKRRVSIGQELVGNPQILFLDEPTSGLDSATAVAMVDELRRIARERHIAMVLTIHQPSERLFELADSFMLLASGGHTCYFGDAGNATYYFQDVLGFTRPPSQSPIEWMLHLVNKDFGGNEKQVDYIINAWRNSDSDSDSNSGPRAALMHTLDGAGLPGDAAAQQQLRKEAANAKYTRSTYAVGMRRQISVLTRRGVLNAMRNPAVLWLRFAMYVILAVSMGLVWLRLGTGADKINATSFAFYIVAYMVFMSVSVLPAYLEERAILIKEQMNGAYSIPAYIIAHTIYEIPYMLLLSFVISVIIYFMVGLTTGAKRFFIYFANLFLSLFVAESIMVLLAAALPWLIVAITAGAMIFGLFMCVQGVFIPIGRIGWWLRWAKFIALHFYSYSTYMVNQFEGVTYTKNPALGFPDDINGVDVYNNQGVETRMWVNFVALIVMVFVYRALAAAWLQKFVKST